MGPATMGVLDVRESMLDEDLLVKVGFSSGPMPSVLIVDISSKVGKSFSRYAGADALEAA